MPHVKCCVCGAVTPLEIAVSHDAASRAIAEALVLPGNVGVALIQYLGLFRPNKSRLTHNRIAKLLGEIAPDVKAQRISVGGETYPAPAEAWVACIEYMVELRNRGELTTPLGSHVYLYKSIAGYRADTDAISRADDKPAAPRAAISQMASGVSALQALKRGGGHG